MQVDNDSRAVVAGLVVAGKALDGGKQTIEKFLVIARFIQQELRQAVAAKLLLGRVEPFGNAVGVEQQTVPLGEPHDHGGYQGNIATGDDDDMARAGEVELVVEILGNAGFDAQ